MDVEAWLVWTGIAATLIAVDFIFGIARLLVAIGLACLVGAAVALFTPAGFEMQSGVVVVSAMLFLTMFVARARVRHRAGASRPEEIDRLENVLRRVKLFDGVLQVFVFHFALATLIIVTIVAVKSEVAPAPEILGTIAAAGGVMIGTLASRYLESGLVVTLIGAAGFILTGIAAAVFIAAMRSGILF